MISRPGKTLFLSRWFGIGDSEPISYLGIGRNKTEYETEEYNSLKAELKNEVEGYDYWRVPINENVTIPQDQDHQGYTIFVGNNEKAVQSVGVIKMENVNPTPEEKILIGEVGLFTKPEEGMEGDICGSRNVFVIEPSIDQNDEIVIKITTLVE